MIQFRPPRELAPFLLGALLFSISGHAAQSEMYAGVAKDGTVHITSSPPGPGEKLIAKRRGDNTRKRKPTQDFSSRAPGLHPEDEKEEVSPPLPLREAPYLRSRGQSAEKADKPRRTPSALPTAAIPKTHIRPLLFRVTGAVKNDYSRQMTVNAGFNAYGLRQLNGPVGRKGLKRRLRMDQNRPTDRLLRKLQKRRPSR